MTSLRHTLRGLAADSAFALGLKIISIPLGYLTLIAVARLYGAEQLGTYTLTIYLTGMAAVVCRLGLDGGLLRFFATLKGDGGRQGLLRLFWPAAGLVLMLSALSGLAMYCLRGWLAVYFNAPALPLMLGFASLALPLAVMGSLCGEALRALGGVRWVVFSQDLFGPGVILVLVLWFAWGAGGALHPAISLGLAFLGGSLGALACLTLPLIATICRQRSGVGSGSLGSLLRYSWPLYLSSLLMLAFWSLDSLILGFFRPPEEVAFYESAAKTALLVNLPLIAVNAAVPPLFAQLHHRGMLANMQTVGQAASRWMYYVALPLTLGSLALAPELLRFFGPHFFKAETALRLLALAQLVNVAGGPVGVILMMTGHQVTLTVVLALATALGLPGMALAAWCFGVTGLAAAKGLWLIGVTLLMILGVWRHLGIKVHAQGVHQVTLGVLAAAALLYLAKPHLGAAAGAVLFVLVYLICTFNGMRREVSRLTQVSQAELVN